MSSDNKINSYLKTIDTERFNCIYLIYLSSIGQKGLPVFKYGRTRDIKNRFNSYPKNSTLLYLCRVKDCYFVEDEIDLMFPKFFKQSKAHGIEFFETKDVKLMIKCIDKLIDHMNQKLNDDIISIINPIYKGWLNFKIYEPDSIPNKFCEQLINDYKEDTADYTLKANLCRFKYINKNIKYKETPLAKIDMNKENLLGAEDIDNNTYKEYMEDYMSHKSSDNQKYAIEKYLYKQYWITDDINQDFLDLWFRKTYVINNIKLLLNNTEIEQFITLDRFNKNNYLIHDKIKQEKRVGMIKELIDSMGFDLNNIGNDLILDRDTFVKNMNQSIKKCNIFNNSEDCELLFGIKSKEITSVKAFIGFVNTIFKNWGIIINFKEESIWNKELKKRIGLHTYILNYYQNINNYI
jgi:hypothetical protein